MTCQHVATVRIENQESAAACALVDCAEQNHCCVDCSWIEGIICWIEFDQCL